MVQQEVAEDDCQRGWILDGFPALYNKLSLDKSLSDKSVEIDYALLRSVFQKRKHFFEFHSGARV